MKQPKKGRLWLNDGSCARLRPEHRTDRPKADLALTIKLDHSSGADQVAGQAAKAFFAAMDSLADVRGCHGWQIQGFACEGHSGNITSHCHEIDLIRIEAYRELTSDVAGLGCVEYSVNEVASVFIGESGELHVIDRASAQRGEESSL